MFFNLAAPLTRTPANLIKQADNMNTSDVR